MKAIVADGHQFANETVALHPGALAHHDALLNFAKWPYEDPIAEGAFIEVARFNKGHPCAQSHIAHLALENAGFRHDARCCKSLQSLQWT